MRRSQEKTMIRRFVTVSRREFVRAAALGIVSPGFGGAGPAMVAGLRQSGGGPGPRFTAVKALVFDTFGTVVDWRTSLTLEVEALARQKGLKVDGAKFADAWRAGYGPGMNR